MIRILATLFLLFATALAHANDEATTRTERIITLSPNLTEIVFALGRGDEVVAVTDYCQWPDEAKSRERIGALYTLNLEKVLSLKPTIVFHSADHRGGIDRLRGFGIRTVLVPVESMDDIHAAIDTVGSELGVSPRAKELNEGIRTRLAALQSANAGQPPLRVLFVVDNPPDELRQIYVLGPGTYLDRILTLLNCSNVMKDSKAFYPLVSREHLIANAPDLVITSKAHDNPRMRAQWLEFLGRKPETAPRFIYMDDRHLMIPGPAVAERAENLATLINEVRAKP